MLQVHKQVLEVGKFFQIVTLPKPKLISILANDGQVWSFHYSGQVAAKTVPIKSGATVIARSPFPTDSADVLAVGVKRGLTFYDVSAYEAAEYPTIKLPSTPLGIQFLSDMLVVVSTLSGLYLIDRNDSSYQQIFHIKPESIFTTKKPQYLMSILSKTNTFNNQVSRKLFCTKEGIWIVLRN